MNVALPGGTRPDLLRSRHGHARVTYVELFFDLVFVFAITQLSHGLLHDLTIIGAMRTGVLFLAVWWVWIYTAWAMNWLDPERAPVRLLLFAMMLAGLAMAVAIPHAFEGAGLLFAVSYIAIQVGRTAFSTWAIGPERPALYRNFQRITGWKIAAAPLWLAGGLAGPEARLILWALAVAVEYAGPVFRFWLPGLGASEVADWQVEGAHLAERCALFVIIALGESILVTGATITDKTATPATVAAFLVSFTGTIAMWWVYFDTGAERGAQRIAKSADPGHLARAGYTYFHLLIGAGIVLCAVADEMLLAHPGGHAEAAALAAMVGGPAVYLLGNALFKRLTLGWLPLSHNVGLGLLALLALAESLTGAFSPLGLSVAATAVLILVAVWERRSLHGRIEA